MNVIKRNDSIPVAALKATGFEEIEEIVRKEAEAFESATRAVVNVETETDIDILRIKTNVICPDSADETYIKGAIGTYVHRIYIEEQV